MLPKHDLEIQVEGFLGFAGKPENRGTALRLVFARWARSKHFSLEDTGSIWRLVREAIPGGL